MERQLTMFCHISFYLDEGQVKSLREKGIYRRGFCNSLTTIAKDTVARFL